MPGSLFVAVGPSGFGYAGLSKYARLGSAVSTAAASSREAAVVIWLGAENSESLFGKKNVSIEQLRELEHDCAEDGWDGSGALALDSEALKRTREVVLALPDGFPVPECSPEPDGSISLDWICSRYRLFSLSVGAGDRVAYAWLDGADKGHGVTRLDGCSLPARVLNDIQAIANHGTPTLRVA
jgi:hypothetical protein